MKAPAAAHSCQIH